VQTFVHRFSAFLNRLALQECCLNLKAWTMSPL